MKIAIVDAHFTGKTSLITELSRALPDYEFLQEPYYQLAEEGYLFASPPILEDYQAQLNRAIENIHDSESNTLFDRCPLDLLAYLLCQPDSDSIDLDAVLPDIKNALEPLDKIFYLPIENPDRIDLPASEDPDFRECVDDKLKLLISEVFPAESKLIELQGPLSVRVEQILMQIKAQDLDRQG